MNYTKIAKAYFYEELLGLGEFGVADGGESPRANEDPAVAFFPEREGVGEEVVDHQRCVEVDHMVGSV